MLEEPALVMPKLHRQWQSGVAGTGNEGVGIGDGMLGRDGEDCNSDDSGDIGDGWGGVAAGEDNRGKSGRDVRGDSWRLPMPTTSPMRSSCPHNIILQPSWLAVRTLMVVSCWWWGWGDGCEVVDE
jgi:hypothetical protein